MVKEGLRALVVEDEEPTRKLIGMALRKIGFECELAADGKQAAELAARSRFDVVLTDLKMPNKNGHALALDLLQGGNRPLVMVCTGVLEPRLATDLLARGVDDIVFKPIDFGVLATKVKTMVERRAASGHDHQEVGDSSSTAATCTTAAEESADGPVSFSRLQSRIAELSTVLPAPKTALHVYELTRISSQASEIAGAIERDGLLTTEVLRLANSPLFHQPGRPVVEVKEAVRIIGGKRIGELALAAQALASLTPGALPWLDLELIWKRSLAAGLVMESLIEMGQHRAIEEGLLLSSIMQPLGRAALGMLFPKQYEAMIANSGRAGSLQEQEKSTFPTNHAEVMASQLAAWRIPPNAFLPLKYSLDDYSTLARLSEPARTRAELVKVAILLGRLAVDRWQTWDVVQFPSARVPKRLRLSNLGALVQQTRSKIANLSDGHPGGDPDIKEKKACRKARPIAYCNVTENSEDLLVELLRSMGFAPQACSVEQLPDVEQPCVINCLGPAATRFAARGAGKNTVIVSDEENREILARLAPTISLPGNFGAMRGAFRKKFDRESLPQVRGRERTPPDGRSRQFAADNSRPLDVPEAPSTMSAAPDNSTAALARSPAVDELLPPIDLAAGRIDTGDVVHELSNLLTVINGYSQILLESLYDDRFAREGLEEIHKAAEQSSSLIRQLLAHIQASRASPCRAQE